MLITTEPEGPRETRPPLAVRRAHPAPPVQNVPKPSTKAVRLSTPMCLGASLLVIGMAIALSDLRAPWPIVKFVGMAGMVVFCMTTLVALYRTVRGAVALLRPTERKRLEIEPAILALLGNLLMTGFGMLIAYFATVGFARGRQLRHFGRVLLPDLRSNPAWAYGRMVIEGREAIPTAVADQWRENGKTEHASVAAFARLTLDLMAVGAPPVLIAAANRDSLDEIRHTELCFSLACALDGGKVSPGPFPQAQRVATLPRSRRLALAKLAVDSLVDGALHEGVSARIIANLVRRCEVPAIRAVLKEIAADEGRHAAHGWTVVEWCIDQGGRPVAEALLGAIRVLPKELQSQLPERARDGAWERWGIHGHRLEAEEYAAALAHLSKRLRARVMALSSDAA